MSILPVVLWSDIFLWLLVGAGIAVGWVARHNEPLRKSWQQVGKSAGGMAAAAVLGFFLLVGLADSFHYRTRLAAAGTEAPDKPQYSVEVLSVLDVMLADLRKQKEKTYSEPFATRLYGKEMIDQPDGTQVRDYPRLRYGGAHLKNETEASGDIAGRAIQGVMSGLAAWLILVLGVVALQKRRSGENFASALAKIAQGKTVIAWRAFFVSLAIIFMLGGAAYVLSGGYHIFGTDKVGQDVLYLSLKSIRTALVIGLVTTLVLLPLAVLLGILAGYFRGWVDDVIQYIYTTINSIPGVLLIAAAVMMMQVVIDTHPQWFATAAERADVRLLSLCMILGMTSWTGLCRVLRGETLKLAQLDYIQAAHSFGVAHMRIVWRHLLPNLMHIVLIAVVMDFSALVLAEAVLSYVGIGVDPTTISFGTMINNARMELAREPMVWWSLLAAFTFMFTLVLAANLFADAVRDAFDPRVSGS